MNSPSRAPQPAPNRWSRRDLIRCGAGWLGCLGAASAGGALWAASSEPRFRIGACDWSIGKMGEPAAFTVAKEIGLDGVQVSLGTEANGMHLRRPEVQRAYAEAAKASGLKVASLAIGELNSIPYKSDPRTEAWVSDAIDVCGVLGCRVILLAFFGNGDLRDDAKGTEEVVRRLKRVAPKADKAGVILGIESWLSAEAHVDIIQRVGSKAVQVYYDVCNSTDRGYDILKEIRWLGRQKLICEFHAKENGALLGQGNVDLKAVRAAMDDIGYTGWVQIEGAVPKDAPMLPSYQANEKYLRGVLS